MPSIADAFDLSGRVALVTGAGRGLGRAIALRLAEAGAAVGCADVVGATAEATAAEIADAGGRAWARTVDVSRRAEVNDLVADAVARHGRLDVMVNNAAVIVDSTVLDTTEADLDRVRELLGDDAARSLERLAELSKLLEDAGLINRTEGRLELTPKGLRTIGNNALRDLFTRLNKDKFGQHRIAVDGSGHERTYDSKPYEFGDPFRLDLQRTIRNALSRQGSGTPVQLTPEDFEIERTEHSTRSSTVLMLDLSMSMPMRGNFVPAKKVAMALHSLISSQFPRDFLGLVGFSETAHILRHEQLPEVSWDLAYGTNMQHGFRLARQLLARQTGSKQIIMITDGEPTAHITASGDVYFNYPPTRDTVEATMKEVMRCTKEDIRINSFVLDVTGALRAFIEQLTRVNRGRAFFTTPENLGDFVLVDFLDSKRHTSRAGSRR